MELTAHCIYQAAAVVGSFKRMMNRKQQTLQLVIKSTGGGETRPQSDLSVTQPEADLLLIDIRKADSTHLKHSL